MKIAFISDTHNNYVDIDPVDLIIHCGDFCHAGRKVTQGMIQWETSIRAQFKRWRDIAPIIAIPGNHDFIAEECSQWLKEEFQSIDCKLLIHEETEFNGLKIFGTPYQKIFHNWAFNLLNKDLERKINQIPYCDILISHVPPYGIFDITKASILDSPEDMLNDEFSRSGCKFLLNKVLDIKPRICCFGHIHRWGGHRYINDTIYINCAVTDEKYLPENSPIYLAI